MDEERRNDQLISALNQKISDFIDRYERDGRDTREWRTSFEGKISDLQKAMLPLQQAHNIGFWAVVTVFGAFLIAVGTYVFNWLQKHFN